MLKATLKKILEKKKRSYRIDPIGQESKVRKITTYFSQIKFSHILYLTHT